MSDLPIGWAASAFAEVTINHDGERIPVRASDRQARQGHYPYYGASGIIDTVDDFLFDGNYLLVAEDGANLLSRSTPIAFQASGKFWVNNHAHVVTATEATSLRYIEHYLNSIDLSPYVTGSAQPKLTQKALNSLPVPIAPASEQRRIVTKLDSMRARSSRARRELDRIPNLIERYKQAILAKAFTGELATAASPVDDRIGIPRQAVPPNPADFARYLPDLPTLPAGWIWTSLGAIARTIDPNPSHRYPNYTGGTVPLLSTREFSGDDSWEIGAAPVVPEDVHAAQNSRCNFSETDIIFARKGRLGLARKPPPLKSYTFSHTIFVVKPSKFIMQDYLLWYLRRSETEAWLLREMNSNTGVPTLGKGTFELLPVPLPGIELQELIAKQIGNAMTWLDKIATEHSRATLLLPKLDQAILAKAFRGELVSQDPNDEPASTLLERIKAERGTPSTQRRHRSRA